MSSQKSGSCRAWERSGCGEGDRPVTLRLQIETEGKGRSFSALVLARVYAGCAWGAGRTEYGRHRPALMLLGASPEEASAVAANIREGRKMKLYGDGASSKGDPCEVLKSERFAISQQRTEEGTLLLVRHPDLFSWSPGLVSESVQWVCLPSRADLAEQASRFDPVRTQAHLARLGFSPWTEEMEQAKARGRKKDARLVHGLADPLFPAFAAMLVAGIAQRVRFPIVDDPLFWAQLTAALLDRKLVHRASSHSYHPETDSYGESGVVESGYYPGAAMSTSQTEIGEVLARETSVFLRS